MDVRKELSTSKRNPFEVVLTVTVTLQDYNTVFIFLQNANSCPVDRTIFKCICIRAQFGGKILKKVSVGAPLCVLHWSLSHGKPSFKR